MNKGIMKNDKVVRLKMVVAFEYEPELMHGKDKEAIDFFFNYTLKEDILTVFSEEIGDSIATIKVLDIIEGKPNTDIDEVRKIFEETFTATNEDAADLYDDIWNFFEPYLKGGE